MKIKIKSDLHQEFRTYTLDNEDPDFKKDSEADIVVIAGDATNWRGRYELYYRMNRASGEFDFGPEYIYVPGNHEYYGAPNAEIVDKELRRIYQDGSRLNFLNNSSVEIDNVNFIGATLWSNLRNPMDGAIAKSFLPDFRTQGLTLDWYNDQHEKSVKYIIEMLKMYRKVFPGTKNVVVTHHAPSYKSLHPMYEGDSANPCFMSNLEYIMESEYAPDLWIHGHVHNQFDYVCGKTRVIANPKGYPGEGSRQNFNEDLIVEI